MYLLTYFACSAILLIYLTSLHYFNYSVYLLHLLLIALLTTFLLCSSEEQGVDEEEEQEEEEEGIIGQM